MNTNVPAVNPKYGTAADRSSTSHQTSKGSRRSEKREKWASIKNEVHQRYVIDGMTLEKTMAEIEQKYSFRAR
jgi:hypothetical protein